jgi:hypothetical protein
MQTGCNKRVMRVVCLVGPYSIPCVSLRYYPEIRPERKRMKMPRSDIRFVWFAVKTFYAFKPH